MLTAIGFLFVPGLGLLYLKPSSQTRSESKNDAIFVAQSDFATDLGQILVSMDFAHQVVALRYQTKDEHIHIWVCEFSVQILMDAVGHIELAAFANAPFEEEVTYQFSL